MSGISRRCVLQIGASTLLLSRLGVAPARAAWPERPVRIVVPFAAGGPPDFVSRTISEPFSREIGGTVVVENRPGAGGSTGALAVARSEPDGYTLFLGTSSYVVNKALNHELPYDPVRDFTPLCEIANAPNVFVVNSELGVKTMKEFIEYARARAGSLNYSSPGTGTTPQLSSELLKVRAGIQITHVPYNSGPGVVQALLTNLVQMACSSVPLVQPHIESGAFRPLAVTSARRWRGLPDVPTMAEAGFNDFVLDTMVMLAGPANMNAQLVDKLSGAMLTILQQPALRKSLETGGFDIVAKDADALGRRLRSEVTLWRDVVQLTKVKL